MAKSKTTSKVNSKVKAGTGTSTVKRETVVRKEILEMKKQNETSYMEMARLLSEAYHKEFHIKWGFADFREYCSDELDIEYRKSMYFVDIWDKVKSLNLSKARVTKLGWTKMKDIAAVVTEDNMKELLDNADKMTTRELQEHVKIYRTSDGRSKPKTVTMKFVMATGSANIVSDALEEAKKLTENDNEVLALEMICQDWLQEKGVQPERVSITDAVKYLEQVYGVKITVKAAKKVDKKTEKKDGKKEADKVIDKAKDKGDKKKKAAKKEDDASADIDDLLGDDDKGSSDPLDEKDTGGDEGQDIDDILGL